MNKYMTLIYYNTNYSVLKVTTYYNFIFSFLNIIKGLIL